MAVSIGSTALGERSAVTCDNTLSSTLGGDRPLFSRPGTFRTFARLHPICRLNDLARRRILRFAISVFRFFRFSDISRAHYERRAWPRPGRPAPPRAHTLGARSKYIDCTIRGHWAPMPTVSTTPYQGPLCPITLHHQPHSNKIVRACCDLDSTSWSEACPPARSGHEP